MARLAPRNEAQSWAARLRKASPMSLAKRFGSFLLLIACSFMVIGGGALSGNGTGLKFHDLNGNGVQDAGEPGLSGWTIHLFDTGAQVLVQSVVTSAANPNGIPPTPDGYYNFVLPAGNYTVCEQLPLGWEQSAPGGASPIPSGTTQADCSAYATANGLMLAPRGYNFTIPDDAPLVFSDMNFGNLDEAEARVRLGRVQGTRFNDRNRNGVQDAGESGVANWPIRVFGTTSTGDAVYLSTGTDSAGVYRVVLPLGTYVVCEALEPGGVQTVPAVGAVPPGGAVADCSIYASGGTLALAPRGYELVVRAGANLEGVDFGNTANVITGVRFDDRNGDGLRDSGEPGVPGWMIHLVEDRETFSELVPLPGPPGPPIRATIKVDRHGRGTPRRGGLSTTTGGDASIVLTRGPLQAKAEFNVGRGFLQGCRPNAEISHEEELRGDGFYIPIADYGLPKALLAGLFTQLGVTIDPVTFFPIITKVIDRDCQSDPNPANRVVANPGVLIVKTEIGFVSKISHTTKAVVATTTTNAAGEYEFSVGDGTYTVCEQSQPGLTQTAPTAGPGRVSCADSFGLGARGHVVTVADFQVASGVDFGDTSLVTAPGDVRLWLGLKNGDDQGARFDVKVELLKNGVPVASGLSRCIAGLTRNPTLATPTVIPFDVVRSAFFTRTDVAALKVSTRIGTNPNDGKCTGPGSSHASARGLRLYYDAANRPSHVDVGFTPGTNDVLYLDSNGTACPGGGGESAHVTERTLTKGASTGLDAKCKDSSPVSFAGGNFFEEIGTWTLPVSAP
jgi:hypothetical protein